MDVVHRPIAVLVPPDVEDGVNDGRSCDGDQADDDDGQEDGRGRGLALVIVVCGEIEGHVGVQLVVGVAGNPQERDVVERHTLELCWA